ncbi:uncharacterized protein LOC106176439 isoform X2 [Lingula anatina]|uniref:Uncharacterized protein LOC106176439 isoform X2 n=1 Tax=Lingula anatina TaxID=7574 RepID=A0A1S3JVG6_LINAN|nr:uncharacterized protein LOC106176439 isoform X2 [Lingula anatina]|eukprot:XP_013414282.1 uncharacterized protein LOC106176439 isoform X2 [Lingula anatina]
MEEESKLEKKDSHMTKDMHDEGVPLGLKIDAKLETEAKNESHGDQHLIQHMAQLREDGLLCDMTLRTKTDNSPASTFKTHKVLLVTFSEYFGTLLKMGILANDYLFPDLTSEGLSAVLNFIYGKKLSLREENIVEISNAANRLIVHSAISICNEFRKQTKKEDEKRLEKIMPVAEVGNKILMSDSKRRLVQSQSTFNLNTKFLKTPPPPAGSANLNTHILPLTTSLLSKTLTPILKVVPVTMPPLINAAGGTATSAEKAPTGSQVMTNPSSVVFKTIGALPSGTQPSVLPVQFPGHEGAATPPATLGNLTKTIMVPVNYPQPLKSVGASNNSVAHPVQTPPLFQLNGPSRVNSGNMVGTLISNMPMSFSVPASANQSSVVKLSTAQSRLSSVEESKKSTALAPRLDTVTYLSTRQPPVLAIKPHKKRKAPGTLPPLVPKKVTVPDCDMIGEPRVLLQRISQDVLKTVMPEKSVDSREATSSSSQITSSVVKATTNFTTKDISKTVQGVASMLNGESKAVGTTSKTVRSITDIWHQALSSKAAAPQSIESKQTDQEKGDASSVSPLLKDYMDIPEFEVVNVKTEPDTSEYEAAVADKNIPDQFNGGNNQSTLSHNAYLDQDLDIKPDLSHLFGAEAQDTDPSSLLDVKPTIELVDDQGSVIKVRVVEELPPETVENSAHDMMSRSHTQKNRVMRPKTGAIRNLLNTGIPQNSSSESRLSSLFEQLVTTTQGAPSLISKGSRLKGNTVQMSDHFKKGQTKNSKSAAESKLFQSSNSKFVGKHPNNAVKYTCGYCLEDFKHPQAYHLHQQQKHKWFFSTNRFSLRRHYLKAIKQEGSNKKTFLFVRRKVSCMQCLKTFRKRRDLKFHRKLCHTHKSSDTVSQEPTERALKMNLRPKASGKITCEFCLTKLKCRKDLILHQARLHGLGKKFQGQKVKCIHCEKKFQNKELFQNHFLSLHGQIVHFCPFDLCEFTYGDFWTVQDHIKAEHHREYTCKACPDFKTSSYVAFLHHLKHHIVCRMPATCPVKGCSFKSKSTSQGKHTLQRHLAKSHGTKMKEAIWCPVLGCSYVTYMPANITSHLLLRHQDKSELSCQQCDKKFKTLRNLKHHLKTWHSHREVKIYDCKQCMKKFRSTSAIRKHERICGKGKFLCCDYCDYKTNEDMALRKNFK